MDESAIDRAKQRIEQRADAAAVDVLLARTREQLEALLQEAERAASSLPERIETAVHEGLQGQVTPVARNLAEIRGLMNQLIRRLDAVERDGAAERHARVDDLALLVELITSGWHNVDDRVSRIEAAASRLETAFARLEQALADRGGAIVYRIEERRPDVAPREG